MIRPVFFSTDPQKLFPSEHFDNIDNTFVNDNYVIISELNVFTLTAIMHFNINLPEKAKDFLTHDIDATRKNNVVEEALDSLSFHAKVRKFIVVVDILCQQQQKKLTENQKITTVIKELADYFVQLIEADYYERKKMLKRIHPITNARAYGTSRKKIYITRKKGFKILPMKASLSSLELVKEAFIDYGKTKLHADILVIYLTDRRNIVLSVKKSLGISAINLLSKRFGTLATGNDLVAKTKEGIQLCREEATRVALFIQSII